MLRKYVLYGTYVDICNICEHMSLHMYALAILNFFYFFILLLLYYYIKYCFIIIGRYNEVN